MQIELNIYELDLVTRLLGDEAKRVSAAMDSTNQPTHLQIAELQNATTLLMKTMGYYKTNEKKEAIVIDKGERSAYI